MKEYICHSGGAQGADSYFAYMCAELKTARCIAHTFKGHRVNEINGWTVDELYNPEDIIVHSQEELAIADSYLKIANKHINRQFPTKSEFVNNLLRRNYYQVKDTQGIFAISSFDEKGKVKGGTAWAVYMAIDMGKLVYVFDQVQNQWFIVCYEKKKWIKTEAPILTEVFTGIGTREINEKGRMAVDRLFETIFESTDI